MGLSPCSDLLLHKGQNIYPQKKRAGGDGAAEPRHGSRSALSLPAVCLCTAVCGSHQCTDKHLTFSTCKLHKIKTWKGKHFWQGHYFAFFPPPLFFFPGTIAKEKERGKKLYDWTMLPSERWYVISQKWPLLAPTSCLLQLAGYSVAACSRGKGTWSRSFGRTSQFWRKAHLTLAREMYQKCWCSRKRKTSRQASHGWKQDRGLSGRGVNPVNQHPF